MRYFNGPSKLGADGRVHWALMSSFDIPCKSGLYLRRLRIVQTPLFGVYLHEMHAPDDDRDLHDHPFNFWSLILKGGYRERWSRFPSVTHFHQTRSWKRWSFHKVEILEGHSISVLFEVPTYTLVFVGRRQADWGFYTKSGWIPWDQYHIVSGGERQI